MLLLLLLKVKKKIWKLKSFKLFYALPNQLEKIQKTYCKSNITKQRLVKSRRILFSFRALF